MACSAVQPSSRQIAQQRFQVRFALRHVIGAYHAAGWRLHRQLRQQRFGIGRGLLVAMPQPMPLLQFNEQPSMPG